MKKEITQMKYLFIIAPFACDMEGYIDWIMEFGAYIWHLMCIGNKLKFSCLFECQNYASFAYGMLPIQIREHLTWHF